jgi:SDR family mycofactocin-dependent oxidoreductase
MGLLDGQVVFVTGAARGQGRAHALASAREGAQVVLFDTVGSVSTPNYPMPAEGDLEATVEEVRALGVQALSVVGDVRSQADLDQAVKVALAEFGQVDAVIANAGIWGQSLFWELSEAQWDEMIGINLTGVWKTIKSVAPHMIERGTGSMVLTASVDGVEAGVDYVHYTASKHGVIGLMKNAALELAPRGVRCNALAPGAVDTTMLDNQAAYDMISGHPGGTRDDLIAGARHYHPFKGVGLLAPEDVADAAVFLNSSLARRITGHMLTIDAGHMLLKGYNHSPVL